MNHQTLIGINNGSMEMIPYKITDHRLNLFIKESEYIVSKGIYKIHTIKVNNNIGVWILIESSHKINFEQDKKFAHFL